MRRRRVAVLLGSALCLAGGGWACSSFEAESAPVSGTGDGGDGGTTPSDDASDSSSTDSSAQDASVPDAAPGSPCPGDGGTVIFSSSFKDGAGTPTLAGWTAMSLGDASITAVATGAGAVARGVVLDSVTDTPFAVIKAGVALPVHVAFRFSFSTGSLAVSSIVHQTLDEPAGVNLSLSLQATGWTLAVGPKSIVVGSAGAAGALHTLTYRVEAAPDGGGLVEATFDQNGLVPLDLAGTAGIYKEFELGPYWPSAMAPPLAVDYSDVTIWDCAN